MAEESVPRGAEAERPVDEQYEMLVAQADLYHWEVRRLDAGDYDVIFVRFTKPGGRTFVMRLRCDDYPEVAPELRFLRPGDFDNPSEETESAAELCPKGPWIVATGRGPFPVPCIKGHREYYADGWHGGWTNPPAPEHSLYQLVLNLRNAILDHWS